MSSKPQRPRSRRRTYAKSAEKHQRILDAAAKALAEHGYAEAKLSQIARDAGTHAGSLYYYYPSRDDLMQAVLLAAVDRVSELASFFDEKPEQSPLEQLAKLAHQAIVQLATMRNDDYLRAYLRNYNQVPESIRSVLKTRRRRLRRRLTELMQQAKEAGQIPSHVDSHIATQFIAGAINWVGLWFDPAGPHSAQDVADTYLDLLMNGLLGVRDANVRALPAAQPGDRATRGKRRVAAKAVRVSGRS